MNPQLARHGKSRINIADDHHVANAVMIPSKAFGHILDHRRALALTDIAQNANRWARIGWTWWQGRKPSRYRMRFNLYRGLQIGPNGGDLLRAVMRKHRQLGLRSKSFPCGLPAVQRDRVAIDRPDLMRTVLTR